MTELEQYLHELDLINGGQYPRKQINYIKEHFEEAKPYLYDALDNAKEILKITDHNEYLSKNLHFFAIYLLAEFQDKEAFTHIIDTVSMSNSELDTLYSDVITEDLKDILYVTYNGNLSLLIERMEDTSISVYARVSMLQTYLQLYEDGEIPKDDVIAFIRKLIKTGKVDPKNDIKEHLAWFICECHIIEMLDDVKYLYNNGFVDGIAYGGYDDLIDRMFNYDIKRLCTTSVNTYNRLKTWPMFSSDPIIKKEREEAQKRYRKEINKQKQASNKSSKKIKIGRNDPCPCGSGKKYKKCCMNKPNIDGQAEDELSKAKALESYPKLRNTQDDRIYIDDFYDEESIEIDKLLYLALNNRHDRTLMTYTNDIRKEQVRKKVYLLEAFDLYVAKFKKEKLTTNKEYNTKYSIHYDTKTWLKELLDILMNDNDIRKEVNKYYRKK